MPLALFDVAFLALDLGLRALLLDDLRDQCGRRQPSDQDEQAARREARAAAVQVAQVAVDALVLRRKIGLDRVTVNTDQSDEAGDSPVLAKPIAFAIRLASSPRSRFFRSIAFTVRH